MVNGSWYIDRFPQESSKIQLLSTKLQLIMSKMRGKRTTMNKKSSNIKGKELPWSAHGSHHGLAVVPASLATCICFSHCFFLNLCELWYFVRVGTFWAAFAILFDLQGLNIISYSHVLGLWSQILHTHKLSKTTRNRRNRGINSIVKHCNDLKWLPNT